MAVSVEYQSYREWIATTFAGEIYECLPTDVQKELERFYGFGNDLGSYLNFVANTEFQYWSDFLLSDDESEPMRTLSIQQIEDTLRARDFDLTVLATRDDGVWCVVW